MQTLTVALLASIPPVLLISVIQMPSHKHTTLRTVKAGDMLNLRQCLVCALTLFVLLDLYIYRVESASCITYRFLPIETSGYTRLQSRYSTGCGNTWANLNYSTSPADFTLV
jgi:hypothetical protein